MEKETLILFTGDSITDGNRYKKKEQEWLLAFPLKQGFLIGQAQAESLGEIRRELEAGIQSLQQEQKSRSKVIMSVGVAGGVLLSILFL